MAGPGKHACGKTGDARSISGVKKSAPRRKTMGTRNNDLMRVLDVADEIGLTRNTVERLCRSGELPAVKLGGTWIIHRDDFEKMFKADHEPSGPLDLSHTMSCRLLEPDHSPLGIAIDVTYEPAGDLMTDGHNDPARLSFWVTYPDGSASGVELPCPVGGAK